MGGEVVVGRVEGGKGKKKMEVGYSHHGRTRLHVRSTTAASHF